MFKKPVNSIDAQANTIKVNDNTSSLKMIFKDSNGQAIDMAGKIDYFRITKDKKGYYEVTDYTTDDDAVLFRLPDVPKGHYYVEVRDTNGQLYPADRDVVIEVRWSMHEGEQAYYNSYKDAVLNDVEPIIVQHMTDNAELYKGEKGEKGEPGEIIDITNEFPADNLIENGDFETDSLWFASSSNNTAENQRLINTGDGTSYFPSTFTNIENVKSNHQYYVKGRVRVTNDVAGYISLSDDFMNGNETIHNPIENQWYEVSTVSTASESSGRPRFRHRYEDDAAANGKIMEVQYVVAIDLTDVFGAGNEPSKEQIDEHMKKYPNLFFQGTVAPFYDRKELYEYVDTSVKPFKPLLETQRTGIVTRTGDNSYIGREILGTSGQIEVADGDGVDHHPKVGIPTDATPLRPEIISVEMGENISPDISTWQGENATWNGTEWVVEQTGSIYTNITVEKGKEYEIDIKWSDTNAYLLLDFYPKLYVKMGAVTSDPQFTGYSDALYKLTMTAEESGSVEFRLGDGIEEWSASITDVVIRPVEQKVSRAGRIGVGSMDLYTQGSNLAIGKGHAKRVSGTHNYAIGLESQRELTVGNGNVSMGAYAQQLNETGIFNSAFGYGTLRRLVTGAYNTAIGYSALGYAYDGNWNVALGNEAARDLTSGNRNTALGSRALFSVTEGNDNIGIGRLAGAYPKQGNTPTTTAKRQVLVGVESGQFTSEQADNLTVLGFHAVGTQNSTALGAYTEAQGKGSVAIGLDSEGDFAKASEENDFVLGTEKHNVKVPGRFNVSRFTPSSTSDTQGEIGDMTSDNDYVYVKTDNGWKRSALETF